MENKIDLKKADIKSVEEAFPDYDVTTLDLETAAEFFNTCRKKGVQASNTDYLICAVAANNGFEIGLPQAI